ncbi:MAG TPA: ATP-binding cassette domain-containing protein, partial [Steroidobacteraceae bacterium]|nr:ATP-binding cassette domain-containing protein [Steroidobacteraceae bacterium]
MLTFEEVTLRLPEGFALERLSFALEPGRTTALVGPSGCGKSTVLRLAAALLLPQSGSVSIGSQALTPHNANLLRHHLGYVLQEGGLFPHMTAGENVTLMARHLRWDASRVHARLTELLALIHLTPDH